MLQGPRVGIIFGGVGEDRDVSIKTAESIGEHLINTDFRVRLIDLQEDGVFIMDEVVVSAEEMAKSIDVAVVALHGFFGEDGKAQRILEEHHVPFTGSDSLASAASFAKATTRSILSGHGIKVPAARLIEWSEVENRSPREFAQELFQTFPQPCVVKPNKGRDSYAVNVCSDIDSISTALETAFAAGSKVLVEEYIEGMEATVGVIEDIRDQDVYALPGIEIVPEEGRNYLDQQSKKEGSFRQICPAGFGPDVCSQLEAMAVECHKILGLKDYSRTDMRIHPTRGMFVLEVNTHPALSEDSLFVKEAESVGIEMGQFFEHIIRRNLSFNLLD